MLKKIGLLFSIVSLASASNAVSADLHARYDAAVPAPVYEFPAAQQKYSESGGWYLRGDIGHRWSELRGTEYITYGPGTNEFTWTDLSGAATIGAGVGYQINRHFRTDLTVDYWFKSDFRGSTTGEAFPGCGDPCITSDSSSYSALLLMANAYVDLGTYAGVTPYVGAGIGGARVKWADLYNEIGDQTDRHRGGREWRFAWSLMAGASYCLSQNLELDAGYRYTRINGGRMFDFASGVGPGFDSGFNVHEARAGIRYAFGGPSLHCAPEQVAYEQPAFEQPVYKY